MTLKDLLKKKEKIATTTAEPIAAAPPPLKDSFTIIRSDTNTQEILSAPSPSPERNSEKVSEKSEPHNSFTKRFSRLRTSSNASVVNTSNQGPLLKDRPTPSRTNSHDSKVAKRLSGVFSLTHHSRNSSVSSANITHDLPEIEPVHDLKGDEDAQAAWEARATLLAQERPKIQAQDGSHSPKSGSRPSSPAHQPRRSRDEPLPDFHPDHLGDPVPRGRRISDARSDDDIQKAIAMHESGDLDSSTAMFGRLADNGNVMACILYGLALRHGWGIQQNSGLAIAYLSRAASSSANVESEALQKGKKGGGAAKGELVLAIYELANSFRHGWGVEKDPVAARKYYEAAANLGDTDAMNEVARCWDEGYGGKKDRYTSAQYYRLAEQNGSKTLGNTWIWKEKYNPKPSPYSTAAAATATKGQDGEAGDGGIQSEKAVKKGLFHHHH